MAELSFMERRTIESFLGMRTGYVFDFSDRSFQEFVAEATGLDIHSTKYHYASNSKANKLRQFIKVEPNNTFGILLSALCDFWIAGVRTGHINAGSDENLYHECVRIAGRLKQSSIVEHIDAIQPNVDDRNFKILAKSIRESIEKNEPEAALDRLHTFTFRYIRELCDKHGAAYDKTESLNAIFGKYIKILIDKKHIESVMTEKILKYSINVIEAFNDIRNNKSFAHPNQVLNYAESVLIFNNVSNAIKFIESIEEQIEKAKQAEKEQASKASWDDLPF
jgi:hypothetical protein